MLAAAALCALTLLAYSNSFDAALSFDSRGLILQDQRIREASAENLHLIFTHTYWWPYGESGLYRPLTTLSYLFNYAVLGDASDPVGYHWVNLLLHMFNVLLLLALARKLLPGPSRWAPVFVAAIWAVHPILTESVTNVVGRADLLAGAAVLGGFLTYLKSTEAMGWRRWGWLAGLAISTAAGAFSKESAITIAGVILLYELTWWRERRAWRALLMGLAATLPGTVWMLCQRAAVLAESGPSYFPPWDNPLVVASFWTAKLTALKVVAKYLVLLFWPVHLSCDYSYTQIPLVTGSVPDYAALLFVALAAGMAVAAYRVHRVVFFFAGFALIAFLPASNLLFPIGTIMAERLMYLSAVAMAVTVVAGLYAVGRKLKNPKFAPACLSVIVALLAARTWARNVDWRDEVSLMTAAVATTPDSYKGHTALASALFDADPSHTNIDHVIAETEKGLAILDKAPIAMRPPSPYDQAGKHYLAKGNPRRAIEVLTVCGEVVEANYRNIVADARARGLKPPVIDNERLAGVQRAMSEAALRMNDGQRAIAAAKRAVDYDPLNSKSFSQLSAAYLFAGRNDDAAIAMATGVLVTRDMSLRGELVRLYLDGLDASGCAVVRGPNGPAFNPACPAVRAHACMAVGEAMRVFLRINRRDAAEQMKDSAMKESDCPEAPLNAILP